MLRKITLLVPITLLASGCAQQLAYTYESDPPYAHLACWQNDGTFKVMGQTPHTLYYTLDDHHFANRSIKIVPCRAVWASGSYATYPNVISLPENNDVAKAMGVGVSVSCTARHPDDENYEKDLQIAQLEEQRRNAVWGDILITLANGLVGAAQQNANHTQAMANTYRNPVQIPEVQPMELVGPAAVDVYSVQRVNDNLYSVQQVR